eukprot:358669-Chlamydomonas_euryale.AAC.5
MQLPARPNLSDDDGTGRYEPRSQHNQCTWMLFGQHRRGHIAGPFSVGSAAAASARRQPLQGSSTGDNFFQVKLKARAC